MKKKLKKKKEDPVTADEVVVEDQECEKCQEYLQGWKRALADYENMKADLDKNKTYSRDQIKIGLAQDLLPVMDNFEQAVNHVPDLSECDDKLKGSLEAWLQGVTFIKKQFEDVFEGLGIEMIDTAIEFDLNLHEVIEEIEDETKKPGEIIKVQSSGWKIGDRILRPAKVIVNKVE